jgi:hypothetical protein
MFADICSFEQRMSTWAEFRDTLSEKQDPIQATIDLYERAPWVSIHTDPYDRSTWPNPWELIRENQYCDFCRLLGICYTLQLSDCFSNEEFEIHIQRSGETGELFYLLFVGDRVVGYNGETHVANSELPPDLSVQHRYKMSL